MRWKRNGSFDFAEGLDSCVGAKANVPFVRWQFIFSLSLCSINSLSFCRLFLSFYNERQRLRLYAVRDCGLLACPPTPKFERGRMLELPLKPLLHIAFVTAWCSVFQSCKPLSLFSFRVVVILLFCLCLLVCLRFLFF